MFAVWLLEGIRTEFIVFALGARVLMRLCPPNRHRCEGSTGHLCLHGNQMHQRWVHEWPRPGTQWLPRWDNCPTLAHQVPLHSAGVLPQVSVNLFIFLIIWWNPAALCSSRLWMSVLNTGFVTFVCLCFNFSLIRGYSNNKEDYHKSIFVLCDKGGYRLKDNVQFHLYISTSPCGDARIFSPHEAGVEGTQPRVSSPAQLSRAFSLVSSSLVFSVDDRFCFFLI